MLKSYNARRNQIPPLGTSCHNSPLLPSISAPLPPLPFSSLLLCRLAAQTRTKGTEGKGRSPMKRTRRKQPASRPALPPPCTAQASGISFPWQGTGSEQEGEGENRGNSLGRDTMSVTGRVANRKATKDSLPFADSSHCSASLNGSGPLGVG